jgi:uncharacterized membrane protein/tRNA A-37 threonylcarbamoyl transferase component Bud32
MNDTPSEPNSALPETNGSPTFVLPGEGASISPQRIGDFTIIRVLGKGGMGTVYLAEDVRLGRKAAIKTMKPELAAKPEDRLRFIREARAAAAVEHDNIVPIWQVGEAADGSPFIAMPFLQGETLEARLLREPLQPPGIILKVTREVAEGLAAAHARGLIHRDIKPGNVWIEGDPAAKEPTQQVRRCKILDFGLARSLRTEDVQITASGTVMGTPACMAPEQARGETVDHRADLFSLGVMLYRMSTGLLPFTGPNVMAVLTALATVTPPPARALNPNLPQALSDLIARLMSNDPARRPQSAADVVVAVRKIETPAKPGRGRTGLLAALGSLALVPLVVWWLVTAVLRVETSDGTFAVEIDDPETEARLKDGKLILTGPDDKVRYTLAPGERDRKMDAGSYRVRVEGVDGLTLDTKEFTLKQGGKVTIRVTVDPRAAARSLDPDRKAAEWVLSLGGTVRVNDQDREVKSAADLSHEPFRLTHVDLGENKQVSDMGLAHFKDCKSLTSLSLNGTRVSDAGLVHFKGCKNLMRLWLAGTQVSEAGLAYFKGCKNLTELWLNDTEVGDAGVAHFKDCKNLTTLGLFRTRVSDTGLAHFKDCQNLRYLALDSQQVDDAGLANFKDCKNLTILSLHCPQVTDTGLAYFKGCKNLTELWLTCPQVSDAGLVHFKDCKNLMRLRLDCQRVGDAGLSHFKGCKDLTKLGINCPQVSDTGLAFLKNCRKLTELDLGGTMVTGAMIEELKKALPRCKIEGDGM